MMFSISSGAAQSLLESSQRKRTVMRRLTQCVIVGILILGMVSVGMAQQVTGKGKSSSTVVPADACTAIQQYVARIDAARSIGEQARREEKYTQARKELEPVLQRYNLSVLVDEASEYAKLTEVVVRADPTDPKLADLLDKRLKVRGALLERCDQ